jgi:hypothetical protein
MRGAMLQGGPGWEEEGVTTETQRIIDKLDQLQVEVGSVAKEQARIQGTQDGTKLAIEAVSNAIGDVTKVKIESAAMGAKVDNIINRLGAMEREQEKRDQALATRERDKQWQGWITHTLSGLAGGGGAVALLRFFHP